MDHITASKGRVAFAEVCVEVQAKSIIPSIIKVLLSEGNIVDVSMEFLGCHGSKVTVHTSVDIKEDVAYTVADIQIHTINIKAMQSTDNSKAVEEQDKDESLEEHDDEDNLLEKKVSHVASLGLATVMQAIKPQKRVKIARSN
ncbi:hypothetical protein PTKIN_Ptkin01aG0128400 [Pterospermum kingtungense]